MLKKIKEHQEHVKEVSSIQGEMLKNKPQCAYFKRGPKILKKGA